MSKRALLVIDLQEDFLPGGVIGSKDKGIVAIISELLHSQRFDLTIATQDWHPKDHVSFAATHGKEPGQEVTVDGITYQLFVEHCIQHSQGARYPAQLQHYNFSKTLQKGMAEDDECFSAFVSFGKHRDTGLGDYLRLNGVKQLYIAGVTLEQCVLHSVKHAVQAGFDTYLIEDACAPVDADAERQTLQYLQSLGASLVLSKQLFESLSIC